MSQPTFEDVASELSDACNSLSVAFAKTKNDDDQLGALVVHIEQTLLPRCFASATAIISSLQLFPATNSSGSTAGFSIADPKVRAQVKDARIFLDTLRSDGTRLWNVLEAHQQQAAPSSPLHHHRARCIAVDLVVASLPKPCALWRDAGILSASAVLEAAWMMIKAASDIVATGANSGTNDGTSALARADEYLTRVWQLATSSSSSGSAATSLVSARSCMSAVAMERLLSLACDAASCTVSLLLLADKTKSNTNKLQRCTAHVNSAAEVLSRVCPALAPSFIERAATAILSAFEPSSNNNNNNHGEGAAAALPEQISLCFAVSKLLQQQPQQQQQQQQLGYHNVLKMTELLSRVSLVTARLFFLQSAASSDSTSHQQQQQQQQLLGEALSFANAAELQCRQCSVLPSAGASSAALNSSISAILARSFQLRARIHCELLSVAAAGSDERVNRASDAIAALTALFDVAENLVLPSHTSKRRNSNNNNPKTTAAAAAAATDDKTIAAAMRYLSQVAKGVNRVCSAVAADNNASNPLLRHVNTALSAGLSLLLRVAKLSQQHNAVADDSDFLMAHWLCKLLACFQQQDDAAAVDGASSVSLNRSLVAALLDQLSQTAAAKEAQQPQHKSTSQQHQQTNPLTLVADSAINNNNNNNNSDNSELDQLARKFSLVWPVALRGLSDLTTAATTTANSNAQHLDASIVLRLLCLACEFARGCGVEQQCISLRALARAQLLLSADVAAAMQSLDRAQQLEDHSSPHTALLRFQLHLAALRQEQQQQQKQNSLPKIEQMMHEDLDDISRGRRVSDVTEALGIAAHLCRDADLPQLCAAALRKLVDMGGEPSRLLPMLQAWVECEQQQQPTQQHVHSLDGWIWCGESVRKLLQRDGATALGVGAGAHLFWASTLAQRGAVAEVSGSTARLCRIAVSICRSAIDHFSQNSNNNNNNNNSADETLCDESQQASQMTTTTLIVKQLHGVLRWAAVEYLAQMNFSSSSGTAAEAAAEAATASHEDELSLEESLETIRAVKRSLDEDKERQEQQPSTLDSAHMWHSLIVAEFACVIALHRARSAASSSSQTSSEHNRREETANVLNELLSELHQRCEAASKSRADDGGNKKDEEELLQRAMLIAGLAKLSCTFRSHVSLDAITGHLLPLVEEITTQQQPPPKHVLLLELNAVFLAVTALHDALDAYCVTRAEQLEFAGTRLPAVAAMALRVVHQQHQSDGEQQQQQHRISQALDGASQRADDDDAATRSQQQEHKEEEETTKNKNNNNNNNQNEVSVLLTNIAAAFRAVVCQLWNSAVFSINLHELQQASSFAAGIREVDTLFKQLHRLCKSGGKSAFSAHVGFIQVLVAQFEAATSDQQQQQQQQVEEEESHDNTQHSAASQQQQQQQQQVAVDDD